MTINWKPPGLRLARSYDITIETRLPKTFVQCRYAGRRHPGTTAEASLALLILGPGDAPGPKVAVFQHPLDPQAANPSNNLPAHTHVVTLDTTQIWTLVGGGVVVVDTAGPVWVDDQGVPIPAKDLGTLNPEGVPSYAVQAQHTHKLALSQADCDAPQGCEDSWTRLNWELRGFGEWPAIQPA